MPVVADFGILGPCLLLLTMAMGIAAVLAATGLWAWTLVDVTREPNEGRLKLLWLLVVLLTYVFGAVLYLLIRRPVRLLRHGR